MKYLTLLRGINVGGNNIVKMSDLADAFTSAGFTNVSTYINSGNIIFDADKTNSNQLTKLVEDILKRTFFEIKTVILSQEELKIVINQIPKNWKTDDLRKYIAFVRKPATPEELLKEAQPKKGIDFIEVGQSVVYMSTKMDGLTKSSFPKLLTKKIYKEATMRNYTTVQKLLSLMEQH